MCVCVLGKRVSDNENEGVCVSGERESERTETDRKGKRSEKGKRVRTAQHSSSAAVHYRDRGASGATESNRRKREKRERGRRFHCHHSHVNNAVNPTFPAPSPLSVSLRRRCVMMWRRCAVNGAL